MLTTKEGDFGKIWADTNDPIVFLNLKPIKSNELIKKTFEVLNAVIRLLERERTAAIFLVLNLKEATGSCHDLMALFIQGQLRFRVGGLPIYVSLIQSGDKHLMEIVSTAAAKFNSNHVSFHRTFEDALRQISYIIRTDEMSQTENNWFETPIKWIAKLIRA